MKFLVDENLSPVLADTLTDAGHPSQHVRDRGLRNDSDDAVLNLATAEDLVVISADTDFGELLARSNASGPSVILLRRQSERRARAQAALILTNLRTVEGALEEGAIVVLDDMRIRVRSLPLFGDG